MEAPFGAFFLPIHNIPVGLCQYKTVISNQLKLKLYEDLPFFTG